MMKKTDGADQAFPGMNQGLTKREWFAGQALAGMCADPIVDETQAKAALAVETADKIILLLNIEQE